MEALKYIRKIESDNIVISDLGQFLGKDVEIIILPLSSRGDDESGKSSEPGQKHRAHFRPFEAVSMRGKGPTAAEMVIQDRI